MSPPSDPAALPAPPPSPDEGYAQVPPPPGGLAVADGPPLGGALHPAAVGVWSTGQLGALVFLLVLNPSSLVIFLPLLLAFVAASAVRWRRFRWELTPTALIIEQGLLNRQRRVIPLERIQSVDLVRRLSHRLFGVVGVQVEAIGGGETEGQLDALRPAVAGRLRAQLLAGRAAARGDRPPPAPDAPDGAGAPAGDPGALLATTSPRRLLLAGVTEANATLIVGLLGLGWQVAGDRIDELAQRLPALLAGNVAVVATLLLVVVAVALLIAAQFLAFWSFTLHRDDDELRVRRGLLEQRFDTIPLRRVQALRVEENLPRRLLGRASVKADVAGKPGGGSGGTDTLLPLGTTAEARALVDAVLGLDGVGGTALTPMPRRARTRRLVRATLTVAVPTALAAWLVDPRLLALALLLVPALAAAEASYRALGHAELDDVVVVRSGWWVRRTAYVPLTRLQALALDQTLLQRWRALGTVRLGIARSPGLWAGPQMIDLDRDVAFAIVRALAPAAARSRRPSTAGSTAVPAGSPPPA
jgi:putative membrane protein